MRTLPSGKSAFLLFLLAALVSCGEMDTMISTASASYTVGATVNERDLDEFAVVGAESAIRPVFIADSAKDPDAVAFRVDLYGQTGEAVAEAVEYRVKGSPSRSSASDAEFIMVDSLSGELPTFSLPADLPVGRYALLFQVLGEDGVLYEKKQAFFYTAGESFVFSSLLSYPPGAGPSSAAPLFLTKMPLLLEAAVEAGSGLDPYLIWTFGGKRIAAGRLSDGGSRILWTTPGSAGFYRIDVSLFPVVPLDEEIADLPVIVRSLTIATSPSAAYPGLPGKNAEFQSIYRFLGDLSDSGSAGFSAMQPEDARSPEWLPFSSGYGLAVGPLRSFKAERTAASVQEGVPAPTRITLAAAPRSSGRLYSAVFKGADASTDDFELRLETTKTGPVLTVYSGGVNKVAAASEAEPFDGEVRHYRIDLSASDAVPSALTVRFHIDGELVGEIETAELRLSSVEGYFVLGGTADTELSVPDAIVAVVDDLAAGPLPKDLSGIEPPKAESLSSE